MLITISSLVFYLFSTMSSVQHLKGVVLTDLWFERSLEEDRVITNYQYFMYKPLKTKPIPGKWMLSKSRGLWITIRS